MHTEGQARELLAATERAKGALKRGPVVTASDHGEPTLAELGITKNESSKAQRLAALPTPRPASPLGARQAAATPPRREGGKFRTVRNFTPPNSFLQLPTQFMVKDCRDMPRAPVFKSGLHPVNTGIC